MSLKSIKILHECPILVSGLCATQNILCGAMTRRRSYCESPLILAVENLCSPDALLTKPYNKICRILYQCRYCIISSKTPAQSSGVQLKRYLQFYINYLQPNLSSSDTLYQAIVKLAQHFCRHFPNSSRSSPQLLQIHWLGMYFVS